MLLSMPCADSNLAALAEQANLAPPHLNLNLNLNSTAEPGAAVAVAVVAAAAATAASGREHAAQPAEGVDSGQRAVRGAALPGAAANGAAAAAAATSAVAAGSDENVAPRASVAVASTPGAVPTGPICPASDSNCADLNFPAAASVAPRTAAQLWAAVAR
eukprot:CAMPEP_0179994256 /NCGR_PEP_ID=MMETSP0984-20121128/6462_1 /TAXON_ID=483367 /ORGANISM="non described non described, Strain CCMP 2436" /LENGTH=159 /DNA_ID=CAMNT_0021913683 /DNA_START=746 /DNA_END=1221 /DNA_ORIENTATION=+